MVTHVWLCYGVALWHQYRAGPRSHEVACQMLPPHSWWNPSRCPSHSPMSKLNHLLPSTFLLPFCPLLPFPTRGAKGGAVKPSRKTVMTHQAISCFHWWTSFVSIPPKWWVEHQPTHPFWGLCHIHQCHCYLHILLWLPKLGECGRVSLGQWSWRIGNRTQVAALQVFSSFSSGAEGEAEMGQQLNGIVWKMEGCGRWSTRSRETYCSKQTPPQEWISPPFQTSGHLPHCRALPSGSVFQECSNVHHHDWTNSQMRGGNFQNAEIEKNWKWTQ